MKQFAAIVFSLLLVAAQTVAVPAPVCGGASVAAGCGCCGEDCQCCVGESGPPAAPPVESTAPVAAQYQFALPPSGVVLFTLASPPDEVSPAADSAAFRAALGPLFQRNCVFLI